MNEFGSVVCGLAQSGTSTIKNYYEIEVDLSNADDGTYRLKFTVSFHFEYINYQV